MHIYFLVSFAINSLWGDYFEPCHWRNITTSPGPGSMDCLISTSLLRYYIYIYTSERERKIYIYIGYTGYRICVAARVFVWKEEITFLDILGGFSSHGHGIIVECQRVPLLFCPIVLLLPRENVPDHRSRSKNTERGGGGTAVPGRVPQQVTGLWGQNRGTVT